MTDHDTDVVALLRALPIFAGLDEGVLARIAQRCVARSVGEGHVLFTTGEACRGLYVVAAGRVRIYRTSPEGREQVLHVEGPGRSVAELPLFDGGAYPATSVSTGCGVSTVPPPPVTANVTGTRYTPLPCASVT